MFYEEKIIDGELHWRGSPKGTWILLSNTTLTEQIVGKNDEITALMARCETAEALVARMPRTADGVLLWDGEDVYVYDVIDKCIRLMRVGWIKKLGDDLCVRIVSLDDEECQWTSLIDYLYSTRAAAIKAQGV